MERNYGYNRNNSYLNRYSSKNPKGRGTRGIDKTTVNRVANQLIVSACIVLVVMVLSNFTNPVIDKAINSVKWVVGTNYDFKTTVASLTNRLNPGTGTVTVNNSKGLAAKTDAQDASSVNAAAMIMPVEGTISSPYGQRVDPISHKDAFHYGIDIAADKGTPIKAVQDGTVIKIENNDEIGRAVTLQHDDGLVTLYGHCSEILVDKGDVVKKGDYIAKVGDTGKVTSAHLHFQVSKDGKQIDPLSIIESANDLK